MGYNKIILQGNLTRDIELRYTPGDTAVGNSAIAVSRKYKSATGEQKEETLFVDLALFGRTAEIANQYLQKGAKVLVDGKLKLEQWTAQDGTKRSKHSVSVESLQMLGCKEGNHQETPSSTPPPTPPAHYQPPAQAPLPEIDDEIPF